MERLEVAGLACVREKRGGRAACKTRLERVSEREGDLAVILRGLRAQNSLLHLLFSPSLFEPHGAAVSCLKFRSFLNGLEIILHQGGQISLLFNWWFCSHS